MFEHSGPTHSTIQHDQHKCVRKMNFNESQQFLMVEAFKAYCVWVGPGVEWLERGPKVIRRSAHTPNIIHSSIISCEKCLVDTKPTATTTMHNQRARATRKLYYAAVIASANSELFILIKLRAVCVFASSSSPLCAKFCRPILLTTYSGNELFFLSATTNLLLRSHISHIKVLYSAHRTHTHTQTTNTHADNLKMPSTKNTSRKQSRRPVKSPVHMFQLCKTHEREKQQRQTKKKLHLQRAQLAHYKHSLEFICHSLTLAHNVQSVNAVFSWLLCIDGTPSSNANNHIELTECHMYTLNACVLALILYQWKPEIVDTHIVQYHIHG